MSLWPFAQRYSLQELKLFNGFTDYHSHLLPGVDDGVQSESETLRILAQYESCGVNEVWFTPHIMEDMPNTTTALKEQFARFQTLYTGRITLRLAAEYMLDTLFDERFRARDLLPLGINADHLLVETSYFSAPMGYYDTLVRILAAGYFPVLAHPERYRYMQPADYKTLKSIGVKFQLNLTSLVGMHDKSVARKSQWLAQNGMYDLMGSDTHRFEQFIKLSQTKKLTTRRYSQIAGIVTCAALHARK